ncbi:MAG: DUF2079 domain-containing protein [Ilumatobacteraceae bacterium]
MPDEVEELTASDVARERQRAGERTRNLRRLAGRLTRWQILFFAMVFVYVVYFTSITLEVHDGLGTSTYDIGLYQQGLWLLAHGKAPFVTLMGRNLLGDHASLILLPLVPIYRLFPSAGTLFFIQSLAIGLGALPVFLAARRRLQSEAMALVLAACFLLHPAVGWTNRENFHPDCFLAFFVGMAIYGALERRWRLYWVFVVLTILVKEDVSLVLLPLGVWVAMRRDRRTGMVTVGATVLATLLGMYVLMRSLIGIPTRNAWRVPFDGPFGLARELVERPGNVIEHFRSDNRPFYVWQMTFPVAFVFLRRPSLMLVSALVLFTNLLSTFWYQYHIEYHYSLIAVPAIVLGSIYALEVVGQVWRRRLVGLVLATSAWAALMWGVVPLGTIIAPGAPHPLGREQPVHGLPDDAETVAAREILAQVPEGASVSAYHQLTPQLANREQIYQFPNPFRVVLYGVGAEQETARACVPAANDIEYVMLQTEVPENLQVDWEQIAVDFEVAARNHQWTLFHRVGNRVRCVLHDGERYPRLDGSVG